MPTTTPTLTKAMFDRVGAEFEIPQDSLDRLWPRRDPERDDAMYPTEILAEIALRRAFALFAEPLRNGSYFTTRGV